MELDKIKEHVKCCICDAALGDPPCSIQVPVHICWDAPKWGNFISGVYDQGIAFVCDACADKRPFDYKKIKCVVEFLSGNKVRYHGIVWLAVDKGKLTAVLTSNF